MGERSVGRGALAGAALLVSACSLAPDYRAPALGAPAPASFKETGPWTPAAPADAAPRGDWWTVFGDPTLDALEARIETGNPDLAAALARYDQARALLGQARAGLLPSLVLAGSSDRTRVSDAARGTAQRTSTDNILSGEIAYELDLWGRIRDTVRSQSGLAEASAADAASARLSLQAQLAQAYFTLRALDAEQRVLADAVAAYERALDLTERRSVGGVATGLDVGRARTQLESARAQLASVRASRALSEHAVASLVGEPVSGFAIAPDPGAFPAPPAVPAAAASVLLQRRPDVAAAERRAYAANARIGVARAAFFPSLDLSALGGFEAPGGVNIVSSDASFWTLGADAALPLFDAGRRRAGVAEAQAELDEASAVYKATVLAAFQEVEDNLALSNELALAAQSEAAAAESAARTEAIAVAQYEGGAATYLDVVVAQTAALDAERARIAIDAQRLQAAVSLIRALGGGWEPSGGAD